MIPQFKSIFDLLKAFPDEQSCINHLDKIRWNGNVVSPFDPGSKVYKCKANRYRCKNTGKYFNVKTGTIFEDSKIPLQKWFLALFIFSSHKKGISSHQLAKDITVTQKTAWFMLHRLRYAFDHPAFKQPLKETVEVDECYIGGKTENKHKKKILRNKDGNAVDMKTAVLGMRQRNGYVIALKMRSVDSWDIRKELYKFLEKGTILYTDSSTRYNASLGHMKEHKKVNHSAKEWVNGIVHTNGIENFWSHLKRGIDGIYHWASLKHLQAYINEFSLRFNTRELKTSERFDVVLGNMTRRLTYQTLIANE